jgi:hypothetical protein
VTSFLKFQMITESPSGKTRTFHVTSTKGGTWLGSVAYYNQWRKYVFMPSPNDLVFDAQCLREIAEFCATETARQRGDKMARPVGEHSPP